MKISELPPDEARRLRSLKSSGLLGLGPNHRFDILTRMAKRVFGVPVAIICLIDKDWVWLKSCDGIMIDEKQPRDSAFSAHTILQAKPLIVPDAQLDERFHDNPAVTGSIGARFYAGCRVRLPDGAVAGSLCLLGYQPRTFSQDDEDTLKDLAAIVEHEFAILDASTTDALTGLLNRRSMEALANYSLMFTHRRVTPMSLAFIDLDKFKLINDTWGHAEGDRALNVIADLMKTSFRENDLISRHGGDEFIIFFPDWTQQDTVIALNNLAKLVDEYNLTTGNTWNLEFSYGVVEYDEKVHLSFTDLIASADKQMYKMKCLRK